jgi:hypothetical protein
MAVKVNWKDDHYVMEFSGTLTVTEVIEAYGEVVAHPKFGHIEFAIVDCRDLQRTDYSQKQYNIHASFAKAASQVNRKLRVAIVVPTPEIEANAQLFIQSVRDKFQHNWERRIFRDYEAGLNWASGKESA